MTYEQRKRELAKKFAEAYVETEPKEYYERMLPLAEIALSEMAAELRTEKKLRGLSDYGSYSDTDASIDEGYLKQIGLVPYYCACGKSIQSAGDPDTINGDRALKKDYKQAKEWGRKSETITLAEFKKIPFLCGDGAITGCVNTEII